MSPRRRSPAFRGMASADPSSAGDPIAKWLFQLRKAGSLCIALLPASVRDPMTLLTVEIPRSVGEVMVDQALSRAVYKRYSSKTCQRFGSLGGAEQPLLSGLSGERDRLVRVRREHTATSLPERVEASLAGRRSISSQIQQSQPQRKRFRAPRALNVVRDHARSGSAELHSSRCCTRPYRPGEETA